jgi:hypothetical protein
LPGFSSQGIFLSYRRDDGGPYASSLQLQLSQHIPDVPIFMDLDSIEPGLDFADVIQGALDSCAVLVVLIGREWATLTDEDGTRRLDNPDDYVRFELKTALERGVRVIPVLLDGARPLRQQELPAELHKLARLNAHKLSYDRYKDDTARLLDLIQRVLADPKPGTVVYSIQISDPGPLTVGDTLTMYAAPLDQHGNQVAQNTTWFSSDPGVVTVDPSGQLTVQAAGTALITATAGGVSNRVIVTVAP